MADHKKADHKKASDDAARNGGSAMEITQRFRDLAVAHGHELQQAQADAMRRAEDAWRELMRALQGVYEETQRRYEDAYAQYVTQLGEVATADDPTERAEQAHRENVSVLQSLYEDARTRYEEAYRRCSADQQEALREARSGSIDAYRSYLTAVKGAWADVDVDKVVNEVAGGPG